MKAQRDLTVGNPSYILISFALPFFIANLLQALYMAVDLLVIGNFSSNPANCAAVANGAQIMMLVVLFIVGFTTGATVIIGKYFGSKQHLQMQEFIGSSICAFLIFTGALVLLSFLAAPWLIRFLNTPEEASEQANVYVNICISGLFFTIGYNVLSSILRGVGNSIIPMITVGVACAFNVVGDLVLIGVYNMGPAGAAYATIASQAIGMILTFVYLARHPEIFPFKLSGLRIYKEHIYKLFAIGAPIAIQSTLIDLSFIIIFSIVNAFGVNASAGYGICCRLNGLILLPAISMGMALTPIIAQNLGANLHARAMNFYKLSVVYSTIIGLGLFIWMEFWSETAFMLFTRNEEIIAAGSQYMKSFCFEILVLGFVFSSNGFLNGSGHTRFSMVTNVVPTFLVRIPYAWIVSLLPGATLYGIGFASPLASFVSVFITLAYLYTGRWKLNRI